MKKLILKPLIYILFFIFTLFILLPKENIYYLIEKQLINYNIILSDEKIKENSFGLNIINSQLYSNNIHMANINDIEFLSYIFYTHFTIDKIKINDSFKAFVPLVFTDVDIVYSILDPLNVQIKAKSQIGNISGAFNIFEKKLLLNLMPKKNISSTYSSMLRKFRTKEGSYKYEYKLQ